MNNKIEPGIMALVIGAERCFENIGKIVNVVRKVEPYTFIDELGGGYRVEEGEPFNDDWLVAGDCLFKMRAGQKISHKYVIISGNYLMPIRPSDEKTEQSKTLELQD
jgi:hypothetical protein